MCKNTAHLFIPENDSGVCKEKRRVMGQRDYFIQRTVVITYIKKKKGLESAASSLPIHPPPPKPRQQQPGLSLCCISPLSLPPPSSCLLISPLSNRTDAAGMSSLQHSAWFEPSEACSPPVHRHARRGAWPRTWGERGEPPINSLMLSAAEKRKGEGKKGA